MLSDPVLFAIMGAGLVVGAISYFASSDYRIRTSMVAAVVERLCLAGNLDRAAKLCAAAPQAPYLAAVKQALAVADTRGPNLDRGHLRARLQEAWRGEVGRREARARRSLVWDALSVSLLGAALGLALSASPLRPYVAVPCGAAVLVLLGNVRRKLGVGTGCRLAEAATLDAMVNGALGSGTQRATPAPAPLAAPASGLIVAGPPPAATPHVSPATAAHAPAPQPLAPVADALAPAPPAPATDALAPATDPFAIQGPLPPLGPADGGRSQP